MDNRLGVKLDVSNQDADEEYFKEEMQELKQLERERETEVETVDDEMLDVLDTVDELDDLTDMFKEDVAVRSEFSQGDGEI